MLDPFIEDVDRRRKRFVVYSQAGGIGLDEQFATRNVTVEHRGLPPNGPEPFVAIYEREEFAGNIRLDDLQDLLAPPVVRPGERDGLAEGYRALFDTLEETLFSALDRRQLLATSREFENRALRVGTGTLRVGFQQLSVFEAQTGVYRRLGTDTSLDIHVYGEPDWSPPAIENVTVHEDADGSLAPFWCLAFDGGHDESQACALVAREREDEVAGDERGGDGYVGFWTYDPGLVADILSTLERAA